MEQSANQCRRYTLPVLSNNIQITQSVTCTNPIPYKLSLNSISSEFQSSKIHPTNQSVKDSKEERNIKHMNVYKERWEDDLPHFDPLKDILYIASTTSDRYIRYFITIKVWYCRNFPGSYRTF